MMVTVFDKSCISPSPVTESCKMSWNKRRRTVTGREQCHFVQANVIFSSPRKIANYYMS